MRYIFLDTETTGLSPAQGHRLVELGAIEMVDRRLTGKTFHYYINPERAIDPGAQAVHGITADFLTDKPVFKNIVEDFLAFIQGATLIIHNAPFDIGFLNHELALCQPKRSRGVIEDCTADIIDTLALARSMYPGQKCSLDALCKRLKVNNSRRDLHGALLDSELLAEVYLAMTGGQQMMSWESKTAVVVQENKARERAAIIDVSVVMASEEEKAEDEKYLQ